MERQVFKNRIGKVSTCGQTVKWLFAFLFCLLYKPEIVAQTGSEVWYFGENAGVNFNTNPPIALFDGAMNTWEGCATLTDGQGNLLMYTNGTFAYNRLHQQMPNGFDLWGDESSFQSVVLVPKPGADSLVYAFIVEDVDLSLQRFSYSVIDLTADNGLGDVVSKNNLLMQPTAEVISAVKHANGTDYWITVHETGNNKFHSYLLTASGISPSPVTTSIGPVVTAGAEARCQIKFSPDGTRLIMPHTPGRFLALFDFDAATGIFSNYRRFNNPATSVSTNLTGVEFSPSGRFIYSVSNAEKKIFQWDLISNDSAQIAASRQQIVTGNAPGVINALQLAPDGKIYAARTTTNFLAVINSPDMPGALCNYVPNGIDLSPKTVLSGLPTCIQSLFTVPFSISAQSFCQGNSTSFSAQTTATLTNYLWNFGDPASGAANTSTASSPSHIFSGHGHYIVTLTATSANGTYTESLVVNIIPTQSISVFPAGVMQLCSLETRLVQAVDIPGMHYQWFLNGQPLVNDTTANLFVSAPGNYHVVATQPGTCPLVSAPVFVSILPTPQAVITPQGPITICDGTTQVLTAQQSPGIFYRWLLNGQPFAGPNTAQISASGPGSYQVIASGFEMCPDTSDAVIINVLPSPQAFISPAGTTAFCAGDNTVLTANAIPGATYKWLHNNQPILGADDTIFTAFIAGNYQVQITALNSCSTTSNSATVVVNDYPDAAIVPAGPTSFCEGGNVMLQAPVGTNYTYTWSRDGIEGGSSTHQFTVSTPGVYKVIVTNAGMCADTSGPLQVTVFPYPSAALTLSGTTTFCAGDSLVISAIPSPDNTYKWFKNNTLISGANGPDFTAYNSGDYKVEITSVNSCGNTSSVVQVTSHAIPDASIMANETSFCEGETVTLKTLPGNNYSFTWLQDNQQIPGASGPEFAAPSSGNFSVIVVNAGLCADTSQVVSLTQNPLPVVKIEMIPGVKCGDKVTLRAYGAATYSWSNGETGSEIRVVPVMPENYVVTGQSTEGCSNSDSVMVNSDCPAIVPNIITPNGDGVNDVFTLKFPIQEYDLQVFNRWGKVVYERKNYAKNPDWKGEGLPDGVYFYSISTFKGEQLKGWVEISR